MSETKTAIFKCNACKLERCSSLFKIHATSKKRYKTCMECQSRHQCPECNKSYYTLSNLTIHRNMKHLNVKPYACPFCNYTCCQKQALKKHLKAIHLKIKDQTCPNCSYTCCHKNTMLTHIQRHCRKGRSASAGEVRIMEALESMNISYSHNKAYEVRSDTRLLLWDFVIERDDHMCFIEYDGLHHFEPVRWGAETERESEARFQRQQALDNLKNEYANANGHRLLRIPYTEYDVAGKVRAFLT